jgi:microcin C transport system substrate-binding protein
MRTILSLVAAAAAAALSLTPALADHEGWHHATSLVDEPKYPEGFPHFEYVNPDAPNGGIVRLSETGTFDNLNFVPPRGNLVTGLGLIYDSLMAPAYDEVSTMYGLIAEGLKYPADYSWVTFKLRPEARWHDGQPITAEDVVWSFEVLTANNPFQQKYYEHVEKAEVTGEREVTFTFDEPGNRELPHIVGQLMVLPKHWWEGDGRRGARDVTRTTLEPPLGSGPYRVRSVSPGSTVVYERVEEYWAKDLPVTVGQYNIDQIRYEYFRDDTVEFEAFKADQVDWRSETTAKTWATGYDFPAVARGQVVLEMFDQRGSGIGSGFIYNLRRPFFQDRQVRQALNLAFNFEETNRTLFFDQYERIDSYHYGSELRSEGLPEGLELEILETVRDEVPPEVFTDPYRLPVAENQQEHRQNLRQAVSLLQEAGYELRGRQLVNVETGRPVELELLYQSSPAWERVGLRLQQDLRLIGISVTLRPVDSAQFINRVRARDFDLIYTGWGQSLSPGNEQLEYFGSAAADLDGSRNYGGIKDPAVDKLIRRVVFARDRDELVAATKALDRVLLWNEYILPGWTLRAIRTARWNRYDRPETLPYYNEPAFPQVWWWDESKASQVRQARAR